MEFNKLNRRFNILMMKKILYEKEVVKSVRRLPIFLTPRFCRADPIRLRPWRLFLFRGVLFPWRKTRICFRLAPLYSEIIL